MSGMMKIQTSVANLGEGMARLTDFAKISSEHLEQFSRDEREFDLKTLDKIVSFLFNDQLVYDPAEDELIGMAATAAPVQMTGISAQINRAKVEYNAFGAPPCLKMEDDGSKGMARYLNGAKTAPDWGR